MAEKSILKTRDSISSHNPCILADFVKHRKNPTAHNWSKSTIFLRSLPICTIKKRGTGYFKQAESSFYRLRHISRTVAKNNTEARIGKNMHFL